MFFISPLAMLILSAGVCFVLLFPARKVLARLGALDKPNSRSSHAVPVVRGGGAAILATISVCMAMRGTREPASAWIVVSVALLLAVVSFVDDLRSLGAAIRFGCHFLAAVVVVLTLRISAIGLAVTPDIGLVLPIVVSGLLAVVWIAGYTNAFNFMDGINGIAGGQAAITGIGMALLAGLTIGDSATTPGLLSLATAAAALGFLPHNFPRARMFMGDVGSAPLGFLLSVLVLWLAKTAGWWLLVPLVLLHANFVLDTGITLIRRVVRGERWQEAHREHFYQRLLRSGKSHTFVTGVEMGLQTLVLLLMLTYLYASVPVRILLIGAVIAIWLGFFIYCELSFRKTQASTRERTRVEASQLEAVQSPAYSTGA